MTAPDTRPPPPQGPPPAYALVTRVYKRSLRPVVLFNAGFAAFWTLASAIGDFRVLSYDQKHLPHLTPFAITLASLYMVAFGLSCLGLAASATQRLPLIRAYAYGGPLSALLIVGAGFVEVVTHFVFKNDLIKECTDDTTGDTVFFGWGFWGPTSSDTLDAAQAAKWCKSAYDHDSWSTIVSLLLIILAALFLASTALAYLRQTLDPSTMRTATRTEAYPVHYAPPYAAGGYPSQPDLHYGAPPQGPYGGQRSAYAPPAGPPPGAAGSADTLPGYGYGASAGVSVKDDKKDDPFADFEEVPRSNAGNQGRP